MLPARARAPLALLVGLAAAGVAAATWPAGAHGATRLLLPFAAASAMAVAWLAPRGATLALAALGPLVPALPRLLGDSTGPPLLLVVALAAAGGGIARSIADGEASPLARGTRRTALAFLAVAGASALSSVLRGETLYFLLRGRATPLLVNGLAMTAADRSRDAVRLFLVFVLVLATVELFTRESAREEGRRRLGTAAALGLLLASVAALLPFLPGPADAYWQGLGRSSGSFTDPNALGVGVGLLIPLAAGALALGAGPSRGLALAGLLAGLLALERSGSRTGLLVVLAAASVALLGAIRRGGRERRAAGAILALATAALAVGIVFLPRGGSLSAGSLTNRLGATLGAPSAESAASHRPLFWRAAVDIVAGEPLTGCGLGGFPYVFPVRMAAASHPVRFTDNATSAVLDLAAEAGLPALLLALAFAVPFLVRAFEGVLSRAPAPPWARAASAALVGLFAASFLGAHVRFPEVALLGALAVSLLPPAGQAGSGEPPRFPPRVLAVLALSGIVASILAALPTARAREAFAGAEWTGAFAAEGRPRAYRWLGPVAFRRVRPGERYLTMDLRNDRPDGAPVSLEVDVERTLAGEVVLPAWQPVRLRVGPLAEGAGSVRLRFSPTFVPRELTGAADARPLSVQLSLREEAKGSP